MILYSLRSTSSLITKREMLSKATSFDKRMFQYAYDNSRTYGVKYNNINWHSVKDAEPVMFDLLDKLARRELSGNAAREAIANHCTFYGDLIKLVCNKDLDCGVTATTLNSVFGKGFIPVFKVQLAVSVPIKDVTLPCIGQIKYNGVRVVATVKADGVTFSTREGHNFSYPELEKELIANIPFQQTQDIVLDGEFVIGDSQGTNHTNVNVNSAIKGNPIRGTPYNFVVFDILYAEEFYNQECRASYVSRYLNANRVVQIIKSPLVSLAETYEFKTHDEIEAKFDELVKLGYEGLILKHWSHFYEYKRNSTWIKVKSEDTAELVCTGIVQGTDKYEGHIGALICSGVIEDKDIEVNVGTGLTDNDRLEDDSLYFGSVIKVKYNSLIQDSKTGKWSLFLPVFLGLKWS